jgi:phosphatidylethanolamine/phosphatidyl-N-methylethanolamine N-methyltransferase
MKKIPFLTQFIQHPITMGAVTPSSNSLAERILESFDFEKLSVIVEYGPGTGVFTRLICKRLGKDTIFFAIEANKSMFNLVINEMPEVKCFHDCASQIKKYLRQYGVNHTDAIISGLPWASFSSELQDKILYEAVSALTEGGQFSTFAYLQGLALPSGRRFHRKLTQVFTQVETSSVIWFNLPPAVVYRCIK